MTYLSNAINKEIKERELTFKLYVFLSQQFLMYYIVLGLQNDTQLFIYSLLPKQRLIWHKSLLSSSASLSWKLNTCNVLFKMNAFCLESSIEIRITFISKVLKVTFFVIAFTLKKLIQIYVS